MVLSIIVIVASVLLALVVWVLIAPLSLKADTYRNEYYLSWGGIGKAELISVADEIVIRLRIAFWKKDFYPLHPSTAREKKKPKPKEEKKRKSQQTFPFRRAIKALKSFSIKYFRLEVDTDDFIWNAYLWPVVYWIEPLRRHVTVNFQGKNECRLLIQNRIWRLAWAWLSG
ncbi:MAG: hypothetical protein KDD01_23125 [Phaeodactylibacter sp.]|nr:hypothetical protein [Phaeodactylibacter sp.]